MKVSTVLDRIDNGALALPEFQRGYVWSRRQVRELVESLYRRFPVGSLLLWETATEGATARGDATLQAGVVSLLLDGQQRITSLYGLIRGIPPPFFDGDARAFSDLRFNVETEELQFYVPVTMRNDPLWVDVVTIMRDGPASVLGALMPALGQEGSFDAARFERVNARLYRLFNVRDIELHEETITGEDKTVDVVVELFNHVNSGGTKLSKGDLALAKICARWPEARDELKGRLGRWKAAGYDFSLDWLLRNVNAVVTGRAGLSLLADQSVSEIQDGFQRAERAIDVVLNLISGRLGLDHDRVLGAVGALPVMTRFVADRDGRVGDGQTADRLLFWYVHALLWGRYAGSIETVLNIDLQLVDPRLARTSARQRGEGADPLEGLIGELRQQRGELKVRPEDFAGWSRGARFYPLLYMLSRIFHARDLGSGFELRQHLLGRRAALEVHHLFPKKLLYAHGYERADVNALANFAFLTLETNRRLSDRAPEGYLQACEERNPGVLSSQWIPPDPDLWRVERYRDFLAERRRLLADAANHLLEELRGGQLAEEEAPSGPVLVVGDEDEEAVIDEVDAWVVERGLRSGFRAFALLSLDGMGEEAVLDIAWPDGLEFGGERVALLLEEPPEVRDAAGRHGFRFFTTRRELQEYVEQELGARAQ